MSRLYLSIALYFIWCCLEMCPEITMDLYLHIPVANSSLPQSSLTYFETFTPSSKFVCGSWWPKVDSSYYRQSRGALGGDGLFNSKCKIIIIFFWVQWFMRESCRFIGPGAAGKSIGSFLIGSHNTLSHPAVWPSKCCDYDEVRLLGTWDSW